MRRLRETAENGIAAYGRMVEDGQGIGACTKADRDAIHAYQVTFGPESDAGAVLALLDIAEAAEDAIAYEGDDGITYCGTCGFVEDICRCGVPMARLRQSVARLREVSDASV